MKTEKVQNLWKLALKNKYLVLMLVVGLILILLPSRTRSTGSTETSESTLTAPAFTLADEEKRLTEALREISGAGRVEVLLSVKSTAVREVARNAEGDVVLSSDSGTKDAVELYYSYPEYLGAVVVCQGADSPTVKLAVTRAVASFTGLGADKITVIKMKS